MATHFADKQWSAHKRLFTNAVVLGSLTTLVKLAAAVKVAATARFFGAGDAADAFLIAFLLPSFCADVVAGAFTPALVPVLMRMRSNDGGNAERRLAAEAQGLALIAMLAVCAVLALGARWVLPLVASGFSAEKLNLTEGLLLVMLAWLPMSACMVTWRAALWSNDRFAVAAGAPLSTPVLTVVFLIAGGARWGIWVLPVATVAGLLVETVALGTAVKSLGYSLRPRRPHWTGPMRGLLRTYWPLAGTVLVTASCALIDQAVAGSLGSGSVSALAYGTRLYTVLVAVSASAIATTLLPEFSRLAAVEAWDKLRGSVRMNTAVVALFMVPVSGVLVWLSEPVVRLLFERGAFNADATGIVADIQRFALLQAPFFIVFAILSRVATAISANGLILRAAGAALVVNAIGDLALSRVMGVAGIPLAAACGQATGVTILIALLYAREPRLFRTV